MHDDDLELIMDNPAPVTTAALPAPAIKKGFGKQERTLTEE